MVVFQPSGCHWKHGRLDKDEFNDAYKRFWVEIRFLGCPIAGDMKTFVDKMKSKGLATAVRRSWFKGMKTKFLNGSFGNLPNCDIVVRQPKKYNDVTSVYIHPHSNFLLLNDLISVLDEKYAYGAVSNFGCKRNEPMYGTFLKVVS